MGLRFYATRKFMPAGLVALLRFVRLCIQNNPITSPFSVLFSVCCRLYDWVFDFLSDHISVITPVASLIINDLINQFYLMLHANDTVILLMSLNMTNILHHF